MLIVDYAFGRFERFNFSGFKLTVESSRLPPGRSVGSHPDVKLLPGCPVGMFEPSFEGTAPGGSRTQALSSLSFSLSSRELNRIRLRII